MSEQGTRLAPAKLDLMHTHTPDASYLAQHGFNIFPARSAKLISLPVASVKEPAVKAWKKFNDA